MRRLLEEYILGVERAQGYQHVYTPALAKVDLYKTSGHWEHYKDSMYPPMEMESGEELVLRPMNCPHHIQIYKPRCARTVTCRSVSRSWGRCIASSAPASCRGSRGCGR